MFQFHFPYIQTYPAQRLRPKDCVFSFLLKSFLGIAVLLCLGFSGCGGGGSSDEAPPAGNADADFEAAAEPAPAPAEEPQNEVPAPEPDAEADPEAHQAPPADAIGSIPPLMRLNEPFAVSLNEHLSKRSSMDAANEAMGEVLITTDEFSQAANAIRPTLQDYESKFAALVEVELKMRTLLETVHYISSRLSEAERENWKSQFQSQAGLKLSQLATTLRNQNMVRASQEISNALVNFSQPYQDIEAVLASEIAANAPATKNRSGPPRAAEHDDMPPEYYESMEYGGHSSSGLSNACKNFLTNYKPEGVDPKKMDSSITGLARAARQELQAPASRPGFGGDSRYTTATVRPSPTNRRSGSTSGSGLTFEEDEPAAGAGGSSPSRSSSSGPSVDAATRKSITYALKKMLRAASDAQTGGKIATAYCLFADEDYVPEVAKFLIKLGKGLDEKDLDFLTSLSTENDYGNDPRVQYLMGQTILAMKPKKPDDPKIVSAFRTASGAGRFLLKGLNVGAKDVNDKVKEERLMALHLLFVAGDGDTAVEVIKLLDDAGATNAFKKAALDVAGQCGDQRVAIPLIRCLRTEELKENAKNALIRIGSPVEIPVLAAFNAKDPQIDLITLEIVKQIGSWDAITKLSAQLKLYTEAKSAEDQGNAPENEKAKLVLEPQQQRELMKNTIETGATIISRMLGTNPPNFTSGSGSGLGPGMRSPMMDASPEYHPSDYEDMGSPDYPGPAYNSGRTKTDDGKSPRTLVGPMEKPMGQAPVLWASALAASSDVLFGQMVRLFSKSRVPEVALTAGMEMKEYDWVERHYNVAAGQLYNNCLRVIDEPTAVKAIEASLNQIRSKRDNYTRERTHFAKNKSDAIRNAFNQGYKVPQSAPAGKGSIY